MNKEEAMKILQHYLEIEKFNNAGDFLIAIDIVLNLIQKQEKIINDIKFIAYNYKPHITQEKIIEYFKKEVEKE